MRYRDLKDHIKNMLKSKYERDLHVRRHKILADECAICLEPLGYVYHVHARVNMIGRWRM